MNQDEEQTLVKAAQAGDRQALATLWENITPKLFGYLINVLKHRSLAEDILQTTWLKAIEALPKFQYRSSTKFNAWLFAIARNECKQHWRKDQRDATYINEQTETLEAAIDQTETNLLVEQMLSKLSEDDREIIRLRYIADLSVNDIAAVLDINFVTARVRLHRAINKARANLKINY